MRSHNSRAGNSSNLNPASKEMVSDSVELCETAGLFLVHPTYWNKCMTSENAHNVPPEVDFESFKISREVRVLKKSQSALFGSIIHDNIVCIHKYDEYMKSIDSGVCHRLWSILWWIVRAYLQTIEYQVVQFVPSISILEQFESIHVTILQQISFLLLWSGGHRCME